MKGPDSGASTVGGKELHDVAFLMESGDILEQFGRLFDIEWLEMLGLEEAEKGTGPIGKIFHQPLRSGDDGELRIFLDERSELFLASITKPVEDGIKILGHHQERPGTESGEQVLTDELQSGICLHIIRRTEHVLAILVRITLFQGGMDFKE